MALLFESVLFLSFLGVTGRPPGMKPSRRDADDGDPCEHTCASSCTQHECLADLFGEMLLHVGGFVLHDFLLDLNWGLIMTGVFSAKKEKACVPPLFGIYLSGFSAFAIATFRMVSTIT